MKNITVAIDDETYRRLRQRATTEGTSLSAVVRRCLRDTGMASPAIKKDENPGPEIVRAIEKVRKSMEARGAAFSASDRLPREELYTRGRDALS